MAVPKQVHNSSVPNPATLHRATPETGGNTPFACMSTHPQPVRKSGSVSSLISEITHSPKLSRVDYLAPESSCDTTTAVGGREAACTDIATMLLRRHSG